MTNNTAECGFYRKPIILNKLDLLLDEINKAMRKRKTLIDKDFEKLKKISIINYNQPFLKRASKLRKEQEENKNIGIELNALIEWIDSECTRMNKPFISLQLYDGICSVIHKTNKCFPKLAHINSEILKYAGTRLWESPMGTTQFSQLDFKFFGHGYATNDDVMTK
jgi:hypothetical protein